MRAALSILCVISVATGNPAWAKNSTDVVSVEVVQPNNPQIDFPGFVAMAEVVQNMRATRLLDHSAFQAMAVETGVVLLDARSAEAFAQGHIDGAINLPLPDFTAQSLRATIGSNADRPILIYCNNNFVNNVAPVVRKMVTLALNIHTMINLHGYGYTNVYELGEAVDLTEPQVRWVASDAGTAD